MLHEGFDDEVNAAFDQSQILGGAYLDELAVGRKLLVQTDNTLYIIEHRKDGLYISGDQEFCPEPTKCSIHGSNFGGSMLKMNFVGRGMFLEFTVDGRIGVIVTCQILEVTEIT